MVKALVITHIKHTGGRKTSVASFSKGYPGSNSNNNREHCGAHEHSLTIGCRLTHNAAEE